MESTESAFGMQPRTVSLFLSQEDYTDRPTDLEEGVPLLHTWRKHEVAEDDSSSALRKKTAALLHNLKHTTAASQNDHNDKMLCYDQDALLRMTSLTLISRSVFCQGPVMKTFLYCCTLCTLSAIIVFHVPSASKFNTSMLHSLNDYLKVFIAFMLGIYLSQAFKRWWYAVTTFEKFLISIRQMIFMLHTLRCRKEVRKVIEKYCVASGYVLTEELRFAEKVDKGTYAETADCLRWLASKRMLTQDEVNHLDKKGKDTPLFGRTRAIWSWIAELISHPMVEKGFKVPPPLHLRCIVLCQDCISEIEHLKLNITMQTPFMCAQLLSILVHTNNMLLACSCGMSIGSAANEIGRRHLQLAGTLSTKNHEMTLVEQLYGAVTTVGVQIIIVAFVPMLYVAFLHISHMLCYPFGDETYHLPTETLIARLHSELLSMAENRDYSRAKLQHLMQQHGHQSHVHDVHDDDDDDIGND